MTSINTTSDCQEIRQRVTDPTMERKLHNKGQMVNMLFNFFPTPGQLYDKTQVSPPSSAFGDVAVWRHGNITLTENHSEGTARADESTLPLCFWFSFLECSTGRILADGKTKNKYCSVNIYWCMKLLSATRFYSESRERHRASGLTSTLPAPSA